MKATPVFREKLIVEHAQTGEVAVAELKIWKIPKSKAYMHGRRFSLFLVFGGHVIIGIDNHSPKGPHLHLGDEELPYKYLDDRKLLDDFWDLVRKAGFRP